MQKNQIKTRQYDQLNIFSNLMVKKMHFFLISV